MAVGLHILYGVMGSGKTNYAVNELLEKTTYKKVICNVPLTQEYIDKLKEREIEVQIFEKTDPRGVIDKINSENPQTFFIVDESQLCLTSANVALCKVFAKKMSQIRQDDQDVNLIAQTSKMLPSIIKEVATDCYKFVNNNTKGLKKSSHVEHFQTGFDYQARKTEEFTFSHVYGTYLTSNWETTEKPKNLYKRVYIKIGIIVFVLIIAIVFLIIKITVYNDKITHKGKAKNENTKIETLQNIGVSTKDTKTDSLCVRSWQIDNRGLVYAITKKGEYKVFSLPAFGSVSKCPLP